MRSIHYNQQELIGLNLNSFEGGPFWPDGRFMLKLLDWFRSTEATRSDSTHGRQWLPKRDPILCQPDDIRGFD